MNKVILTQDRVFMSIVGPSACGKTELLFRMLKGSTFYPRFEKIYSFYKEFQPLFKDMQRVIPGIEFLKYSGFDITKNLSHCLLIYDDSCEEIFNDKEFVKKSYLLDRILLFFIFRPLKQSLQQLQMKKKHLLMLKQWANKRNENTAQIEILHQGDFIWFLSDCVMNVLSGVVPINKVELKNFEKPLRKLADRRVEKVRESESFDQTLEFV